MLVADDDGGDGFLAPRPRGERRRALHDPRLQGFRDGAGQRHAEGAAQAAPYRLVVGVGTPPLAGESRAQRRVHGRRRAGRRGPAARHARRPRRRPLRAGVPAGNGLAVSLFPIDATTGAPLPSWGLGDTRFGLLDGAAPRRERRRRARSVLEPAAQRPGGHDEGVRAWARRASATRPTRALIPRAPSTT